MKAFPRASECKKVRHVGVETEIDVIKAIERAHMLEKDGMRGYDRLGAIEWRTVPISLACLRNEKGVNVLKEYFDLIKSGTEVKGWGGTHIHISILDKDNPNLEANVIAITAAFYKSFQKIAGRVSTWARCPGVSNIVDARKMVKSMGSWYSGTSERRYSRNYLMITPSRYQTLEFRGPKGSNDGEEILAWIEFLENVVKAANRDSVHGIKFGELLKGKRISAYVNDLSGWRAITDKELEKTLDSSRLI